MNKAIVCTPPDYSAQHFDWGELTWFISGPQGSSTTMTVGRCLIRPGKANPRHHHPNCDEALHLLAGTILHSMEGGREVQMKAGDTISIPAGVPHHASNVGDADAVMLICFSSAEREFVPEV